MTDSAGSAGKETDMIRCKFRVDSITRFNNSAAKRDDAGVLLKDDHGSYIYEVVPMATVKLSPVYANNDPNHENTKFWSATPSGSLELGTVNLSAVAQLEIGSEYYIDITPAKP